MMKMMYSLSTGRPATASFGARRRSAPSTFFISSVSCCCADDQLALERVGDLRILRCVAWNWPRTSLRSPRSRASFCFTSDSCRSRSVRSRFRISVSPRISKQFLLQRQQAPSRSWRDFSSAFGSPNLLSMNSRMIAPNAQQIVSRKDMLKTLEIARAPARSWPVPRRHQERAVGAPRQRPERARRGRVALHRHQDHVGRHPVGILAPARARTASAARRRRWSCALPAASRPGSAGRR